MKILVTGGAGFIGSAVIRMAVLRDGAEVVNVDKLTYAANLDSLKGVEKNPLYSFVQADITDADVMREIYAEHKPDVIMHLAAESHVDRSIDGPDEFIQTNIVGTFTLLKTSLDYWNKLSGEKKAGFRFHHVSTDEVYGSLGDEGKFTETTPYAPNSPYSASKASSDMLVRAWSETYGLPVVITNCSNNYGPFQFPEKLIPVVILNTLAGKPIPVYGDGMNVRDWLYVDDHADALLTVLKKGRLGETYNIGGENEMTNIGLIKRICQIMDEVKPETSPHENLITYVTDRPGHDRRYAIDATKIETELGWTPDIKGFDGLEKTVHWYLENEWWWRPILSGGHTTDRQGLALAK